MTQIKKRDGKKGMPDRRLHRISSGDLKNTVNNYLITESEVVTGKSQTDALPY